MNFSMHSSRPRIPTKQCLKKPVHQMSIIGTIYEDVTTDVLGTIGPWQWMVVIISMTFSAGCIFHPYDEAKHLRPWSYEASCAPHVDADVGNVTLCQYMNGSLVMACTSWDVRLMGLIWIKKSWMLYCEPAWLVLSMAMVFRLGAIIGFVIFGFVADCFGRKRATLICTVAELLIRVISTFCDSREWFQLLVFLRAFCGSACHFLSLIIVCEISSNMWRSRLLSMACLPLVLVLMFKVPLNNCLLNVETGELAAAIYCVVLLAVVRWLPESPHWFLYNSKINLAERIILDAAKQNNISLHREFKIRPVNQSAYVCLEENATCVEIMIVANIRTTISVTLTLWFIYYYLYELTGWPIMESRDITRNASYAFIVWVLLWCLGAALLQKYRFRHLLFANTIVAGAFTAAALFVGEWNETIQSIVFAMGLSMNTMSLFLVLIISPRYFGVNLRATMVGCCHSLGQFGAIISVVMTEMYSESKYILMSVGLGATVIAMGLSLMLPDVDDRELPDVLEDMDYFSELSKPIRWAAQKTNSPSLEEVEMRVYSFGSQPSAQANLERPAAKSIGLMGLYRWIKK